MASTVKERLQYVPRLFWNAEEAAVRLNISVGAFHELRKHPLYQPDSEKPGVGKVKKLPMWSTALLDFIAFAWTMTRQGVRQYDDDEAYAIWYDTREQQREEYLRRSGNA